MNMTLSTLKNTSSMTLILAASSILGVCSSSWTMAWLFLEVNTLSMCWMISKETKENSKKEDKAMMYYIIQVASSIMMLASSTMSSSILSEALTSSLVLIKMGVWPAHSWYMKLISSLEMKMTTFLTVMTWQKILPMTLVCMINSSKAPLLVILCISLFSLITPLTKISEKMNVKSIMANSSLNNNSWLIFSSISSISSFIVFLSLYSSALLSMLKTMKKMTKKSNTISLSFWSATIITSNISGLPPFTMFWAKITAIKAFLSTNLPSELTLLLMASACYLLYHYLWMTMIELTKKSMKNQAPPSKESKMMMLLILVSSMTGMLLFIK